MGADRVETEDSAKMNRPCHHGILTDFEKRRVSRCPFVVGLWVVDSEIITPKGRDHRHMSVDRERRVLHCASKVRGKVCSVGIAIVVSSFFIPFPRVRPDRHSMYVCTLHALAPRGVISDQRAMHYGVTFSLKDVPNLRGAESRLSTCKGGPPFFAG